MEIPVERIVERSLLAAEIRKEYEGAFRRVNSEHLIAQQASLIEKSVPASRVLRLLHSERLYNSSEYEAQLKAELKRSTPAERKKLKSQVEAERRLVKWFEKNERSNIFTRTKHGTVIQKSNIVFTPQGLELLKTNTPQQNIKDITRKATHAEDRAELLAYAIALHSQAKTERFAADQVISNPYGHTSFQWHGPEKLRGSADPNTKTAKIYKIRYDTLRKKAQPATIDGVFRKIFTDQYHDTQKHEEEHLATFIRRDKAANLEEKLVHELISVATQKQESSDTVELAKGWTQDYAPDEESEFTPKFAELLRRVNALGAPLKKQGNLKLASILADKEVKTLQDAEIVIAHLESNPHILGETKREIEKWPTWKRKAVAALGQDSPIGNIFKINDISGQFASGLTVPAGKAYTTRDKRTPFAVLTQMEQVTPQFTNHWQVVIEHKGTRYWYRGEEKNKTEFFKTMHPDKQSEFRNAIDQVTKVFKTHAPKVRSREVKTGIEKFMVDRAKRIKSRQ